MSFLKAEWRKLAMANYEVDPALLKPYVPHGTELDTWNGTNYVSLVGFMFLNTKMLGVKIPFHVNFEEVNLRFYVKYKDGAEWKRGVVFIKEIVPKHAITFVANTLYGEHYATHKMKHTWTENESSRQVSYAWKVAKQWQKFSVEAERELSLIEEGSETEFITEHYWGYTKKNDTTTTEYEVTHPKWQQYEVKNYDIDVDFGATYGDTFQFLNEETPKSVMLAEGSLITVEGKRTLK
ncbi:DUF2071 domain-containing protein [Aureisphaera galaxeae]|uniref:YqjF family protein n=1 Tax=Aureisphaera galaxeae TaxID=1538023 RepID=UPI00234FE5C6|nr:DUF2071 domain-containing protein [Aureisphaera galaxeae]MDC8003061.1 DUF2071 domain-containing protein [Aureisphaera galaxeae]